MEDDGKPIWNASPQKLQYLARAVYGVGFVLDSRSSPPFKNI